MDMRASQTQKRSTRYARRVDVIARHFLPDQVVDRSSGVSSMGNTGDPFHICSKDTNS